MAVNFTKYQDDITKAWRDVVETKNEQKWALFGYDGTTNVIKLMSTGSAGLDELVEEFNCSLIQYAFCRVIDPECDINKLILINWQGESAPLLRKGLCASHVGDVANYFKGCAQTITIRNDDEATKAHLMEQIVKCSSSKFKIGSQHHSLGSSIAQHASNNGGGSNHSMNWSLSSTGSSSASSAAAATTFKKDLSSEIANSRKSFWQRQEEEEKERLAEEKRRAAEKQAQFEKERKQREEIDAKKLAETIRARDRIIESTKQAESLVNGSQRANTSVANSTSPDDDDGRVGRRSELMRLERNQETQSLISKGLIKNKRAIFEQAQQQQQQQKSDQQKQKYQIPKQPQPQVHIEKQLQQTRDDVAPQSPENQIKQEEDRDIRTSSDQPELGQEEQHEEKKEEQLKGKNEEHEDQEVITNTDEKLPLQEHDEEKHHDQEETSEQGDQKQNETECIKTQLDMTNDQEELITNEELMMNGKNSNIRAVALYDYQAADNTEISFDPEDEIGHIQKVDSGWWHGQVMTGKFKGQIGLFPANYVVEC